MNDNTGTVIADKVEKGAFFKAFLFHTYDICPALFRGGQALYKAYLQGRRKITLNNTLAFLNKLYSTWLNLGGSQ